MRSEPETEADVADVARLVRGLGAVPGVPPLPDADVLWLRAQVAACQEAEARALWRAALRQALRCAGVAAAGAWLLWEWLTAERSGLDAWRETLAMMAANPLLNVFMSAAAALGIAVLVAALAFGRPLVARRLRSLGLM
jgi:hypothetical protein